MKSGIYQILNHTNGKFYVGSAVNIDRRWSNHRWHLEKNRHPNSKLQRAWNKSGGQVFALVVLELCAPKALLICEQHWIDTLDAVRAGYNLSPSATSTLGFRFSAVSKRKIGRKSKARNQGENHPMFGRRHSPETRAKWSVDRKGKPSGREGISKTNTEKSKLSAAAKAAYKNGRINPFYGRKHTDGAREKMRLAHTQRLLATPKLVAAE